MDLTADFDLDLPSALPTVSLDPVTPESLEAEAAALGDKFSVVAYPPGDLIADAREMLDARPDIQDLVARGYPVSEALIDRIEILVAKLTPFEVEQRLTSSASLLTTTELDRTRRRLLEIRSELARVAKAAGLPATIVSLKTNNTQRINVVAQKMDEVLDSVGRLKSRMPDRQRVGDLLTEGRGLLEAFNTDRRNARYQRISNAINTRQQERYERLLLNALMYLSAQGLAAYPNDPVREVRYRLDHIYGRRTVVMQAQAPAPAPSPEQPSPTAPAQS